MKETVCSCEELIPLSFPEEYSTPKQANLVSSILEGSIWDISCPSCKRLLKLEFEAVFHFPEWNLDIRFYPEESRNDFFIGKIKHSKSGRVCIGFPELVEKVKLASDELDDQIIEVMKYQFLQAKGFPENWKLYYSKFDQESEKIYFWLEGIRPAELAQTSVPFTIYTKTKSEINSWLKKSEVKEFTTPPYVNVFQVAKEEST